ncbi:hypothetical protein BH11PAT1_BH11PAT1_6720 [soil metagenome]
MKFRLILSIFLIIAVSSTAFASTRAVLSDQVTLTANTFSTGTVDLQITTGSGTDYAETHAGFSGTLLPGQTTSKFVKLRNNGSGVDLAIAAQAANVSGLSGDNVTIAFTPWSSSTVSGHIETGASTTTHTLAEWLAAPGSLGNPNLTSGSIQYYKMDVTIHNSVTTSGNTNFDFIFTGTQVVPAP